MKKRNRRLCRCGFTLLELVIAAVLVGILSVGALQYQYYAARDVRLAEVQATAAQVAKTVLDVWKGLRGLNDYNPVTQLGAELTISNSASGPAAGTDSGGQLFTTLGNYGVVSGTVTFYVTCSYKESSSTDPKILNVAVAWRPDYGAGVLEDDASEVRYSTFCGSF